MRVLVVSRELPPVGGGAGYVAMNLASCLVGRGHDVHIVTMHQGDLVEREVIDGVHVQRLRVGRAQEDSSYVPEMARFVRRARKRVAEMSDDDAFDVAHAHAIIPDGLVLRAANPTARTVVTAHGSDVPAYNPDRFQALHHVIRPLWLRAVRWPAVVTAPSEHLRTLIDQAGAKRPVAVIPNGIDTSTFDRQPKDRSILVVSRLVRRKNIHLLLDALRRFPTSTAVHIVGDGPERARLEELARGLEHHDVNFHGWLSHGSAQWKALYEGSRFFVAPSNSENFPINLLEAQLARMVVIASDIPGHREVLGGSARYFGQLTESGLLSTLREALDADDYELEREGDQAAQRVFDKFSWERITDAFEEVYADG